MKVGNNIGIPGIWTSMINVRTPTMLKYKVFRMPVIHEYNIPNVFKQLTKYVPLSLQSVLFWIMLVISSIFTLCSCYSWCGNFKFKLDRPGIQIVNVVRQTEQKKRPYVMSIVTKNNHKEKEIEAFSLIDLDKNREAL